MAAAANAKPGERDHYTFGFGRRVCPGIHLASTCMMLCVSSYADTDAFFRLKWKCLMFWCVSLPDVH